MNVLVKPFFNHLLIFFPCCCLPFLQILHAGSLFFIFSQFHRICIFFPPNSSSPPQHHLLYYFNDFLTFLPFFFNFFLSFFTGFAVSFPPNPQLHLLYTFNNFLTSLKHMYLLYHKVSSSLKLLTSPYTYSSNLNVIHRGKMIRY